MQKEVYDLQKNIQTFVFMFEKEYRDRKLKIIVISIEDITSRGQFEIALRQCNAFIQPGGLSGRLHL